MEDWALIRRLAAEGVPKARIAQRLGISRTTVIKAVNSEAPPRYEREPGPTSFSVFEPTVRALLEQTRTGPSARLVFFLQGSTLAVTISPPLELSLEAIVRGSQSPPIGSETNT